MTDFVTDRLILHALTPGEAARVVARARAEGEHWASDYPSAADVKGAAAFVTLCETVGDPQPFGAYEIRLRSDGAAIGGAGFNSSLDAAGVVPIGYGLVPSTRGLGYATEALQALLKLARAHGAVRVEGDADHDNVASQRVMAASGMQYERSDDKTKFDFITWS